MKLYRISRCEFINDLSGAGAVLYPGRWHSKGSRVLYTASSASLAMLESLAHITSVTRLRACMICLDIPDSAPIMELTLDDLPNDWHINPPPDILKKYGDELIVENKFLALKVPSAILFEENNFILNTTNKDFHKIKVIYSRVLAIDERLLNFGR
ncbi:MAG TPA: RES family NAD+ phosphorylase [Niabella sp.]|jgi:RES domain-containing protein|nr:RES family NAD+ phosphorylase [Chitinophagaceae bacterium]HRN49081.1 RES family NAD+ phosphorylase [Niabella sp.]HRO83197.1 RES family NAD+ phosphorylase [Niabella sp.]